MIADAAHAPNDVLCTLPSCVPATADDIGWAIITAKDLEKYRGNPRILGLGEMMDVPGVIGGDPEVFAKMPGSPTLTDMPRASPEKTSAGMSTEASKLITNAPR